MGCCRKFFILSSLVVAASIGYFIYNLNQFPPVPELDQNQHWGPSWAEAKAQDVSIRPFKIEFTPEKITHLKNKLADNNWYTEPLEGIGFEYGFNAKYLKNVIDFWRTKYDFVEREKYLNQFPQFKTTVQGLDIHFIHIKAKVTKGTRVIPLLLLHGWPGSVVEFYKMIPLLTTYSKEKGYAFDFIVPSLPGYGYSQGASKPGMGFSYIAVIMRNLMTRLGYDKYVIQGGDWGSAITKAMASFYPENIYGYHTNMPTGLNGLSIVKLMLGSLYPPLFVEKENIDKVYPISKVFQKLVRETGYLHLQATKPDTVGAGLMDSPVGLAAYIIEKFSSWTNPDWITLKDGGLEKKYSLTELLDNIMIYWHSNSITTSMRLYAESINKAHSGLQVEILPVRVPTALARFPYELLFITKWQVQGTYLNIVQISDFETGGHFAAFEEPLLLAKDIIKAIDAFDEYYKTKKDEL